MLKNVVLPAPLGPMIETIEPRAARRTTTSLTGDEAAEHLRDVAASQQERRRRRRRGRRRGWLGALVTSLMRCAS